MNPPLSTRFPLTTLLALFSLHASGHAANLAGNESFETPDDFRGWIHFGNVLIGDAPAYQPAHGNRLTVFNGGNRLPSGRLSQTFGTVPGETYTLSCQVGTFAFNYIQQVLDVSVDGATNLLNRTITVSGTGKGQTQWEQRTFVFTADSTSTTIEFRDRSHETLNIDLLLDDVKVLGLVAPNAAPLAMPDSVNVPEGGSVTIPCANLLANDVDAYGTTLTLGLDEGPSHGTLTVLQNGYLEYEANPDFTGIDTFRYHASDGEFDSNITEVTMIVVPDWHSANGSFEWDSTGWHTSGNVTIKSTAPYVPIDGEKLAAFNTEDTPPDGSLEQYITTWEGEPYTLSFNVGILGYNTNAQAIRMRVFGLGGKWGTSELELANELIELSGTGDGEIHWEQRTLHFNANSGTTVISFEDVSSTTRSVDLLLDDVRFSADRVPSEYPIVAPDYYQTPRGVPLVVSASEGLLANDTDPEGDKLTAMLRSNPPDGLVLAEDGSFTYDPGPDFCGVVSFYYACNDGRDTPFGYPVEIVVQGPATQKLYNGDFRLGAIGWGPNPAIYGSTTDETTGETTWHVTIPPEGANIYQTFRLVVGRTYRLSFRAMTLGEKPRTLQVYLGGRPSSQYLRPPIGADPEGLRWEDHEYTFTAWSPNVTMQFGFLWGETGPPVMISGVRLVDVTALDVMLKSQRFAQDGAHPGLCIPSADAGRYALWKSDNLRNWRPVTSKVLTAPGLLDFPEATRPVGDASNAFYKIGVEFTD